MIVYVESNFVLEIALGQEQMASANALLEMAEQGRIGIAAPAFALIEPFSTVTGRERQRNKLIIDFKEQLRDLQRSSPHRVDHAQLLPIPGILAGLGERESNRLTDTVRRLLRAGTVIEVTHAIFEEAMQFRGKYGLSSQDSIVFSSVVSHLTANPVQDRALFANRNWRDFRDPELVAQLGALNCGFVESFDSCHQMVEKMNS